MEVVACDLCGSMEHTFYLESRDFVNRKEGVFSVVRCRGCGLIFTNPRPDKREILDFYPDSTAYYVFHERDVRPLRVITGKYKLLLKYFKGYFPEEPSTVYHKIFLYPIYLIKKYKFSMNAVPDYVPGGTLLEIGSSFGKFLHSMRDLGWNVKGIEMNSEAVATCKKAYGIDLICQDIDSVSFASNTFDVVIMRMVLEHVFSPDRTIERISRWLKPGGQLLIVIPDISGLEARIFGRYFYGLQVPNHLYHFSPESITKYLSKHGLKVYAIKHHRADRDFFQSIENAVSENPGLYWLKVLMNGVLKVPVRLLLCLLSVVYRTGRMTLVATKERT